MGNPAWQDEHQEIGIACYKKVQGNIGVTDITCKKAKLFYDNSAYSYDESAGEISRNERYQGVNALFVLPVDKSKADPEAAKAYFEKLEKE